MAVKAASSFSKAAALLWAGSAMSAFTVLPAQAEENPAFANRAETYAKLVPHGCAVISQAEAEVPRAALPLWNNLRLLDKKPTVMGQAAVAFSKAQNVPHCNDPGMPAGWDGRWGADTGILSVSTSPDENNNSKMGTQMHETVHGIQQGNGVPARRNDWDIYSFHLSALMMEAPAQIGQYLLALELNERRETGLLQHVLKNYGTPVYEAKTVYDERRAERAPKKVALLQASRAAWRELMRDQNWLDQNNNFILTDFIQRTVNGQMQPPAETGYTLEMARLAGKITDDFNIVSFLEALPEPKKLFGKNKRMQEAFDYAGLERLAVTLGRDDPKYLAKLEQLEKDQNPFLGVDLTMALTLLATSGNVLPMTDAMSCYAVGGHCKIAGKEINPQPFLVAMRKGQ